MIRESIILASVNPSVNPASVFKVRIYYGILHRRQRSLIFLSDQFTSSVTCVQSVALQ